MSAAPGGGTTVPSRRKLGEILAAAGVVDELQLRSALGHQRQWGGRLGHILIDLRFVDEHTLAQTLAAQLGLELCDLTTDPIESAVVRLLPQSVAERHAVFPVRYDPASAGGTLTVAFSDPTNLAAIDEVRFQTGKTIRLAVAAEGQIALAIRRYYYGEEAQELDPPVEAATLFGNVDGFLSGESDDDDLAELEPIHDSQIPGIDLQPVATLSPDTVPPFPVTAKPLPDRAVEAASRRQPPAEAHEDPLRGFFAGTPQARPSGERSAGLPERSLARAGPPSTRQAVPVVAPAEPSPTLGAEREHDIFAEVVDLNEKTVQGVVLPSTFFQAVPPVPLAEIAEALPTPPFAPAAASLPEPGRPAIPPLAGVPPPRSASPSRPAFDRAVTAPVLTLQAAAPRLADLDGFEENTRPAFEPAPAPPRAAAAGAPSMAAPRSLEVPRIPGRSLPASPPPPSASSTPLSPPRSESRPDAAAAHEAEDVDSAFELTFADDPGVGADATVVLSALDQPGYEEFAPVSEQALAVVPSAGSLPPVEPALADPDLGSAFQGLRDRDLDTGNWHFAPALAPGVTEGQHARALAQLLIRKGLISEAELLEELSTLADFAQIPPPPGDLPSE